MTDATAAALSKPYGRHAAPRGSSRTVPSTKGPGRHAAPGGRLPLADVAPITDAPEPRPLATRAPLAALVALLVALVVMVGIGASAAVAITPAPHAPAVSCGDYCGTDAGLITHP